MRNMSFSLTTAQLRAGAKTVTRRLGWEDLVRGDLFCAVVKGMGLKKGEKVERIGVYRVVDARREPLNAIDKNDVELEGFPDMSPAAFVKMFCRHHGCKPDTVVTRIHFEPAEDAR